MSGENDNSDDEQITLYPDDIVQFRIEQNIRDTRIKRLYSSTIWLMLMSIGLVVILFANDPSFQEAWSIFQDENGNVRWTTILGSLILSVSFLGFIRSFLRYISSSASSTREITQGRMAAKLADEAGIGVIDQDELNEMEARSQRFEEERKEAELRRKNFRRIDDLTSFDGEVVKDWSEVLIASRRRLSQNADRLAARSRVNLMTGIAFSIVAIFVLVLIVLLPGAETQSDLTSERFIKVLPRYTLVILLQALAFFFLRNFLKVEQAYRENKNEITNIELKLAAGMFANSDGKSYETLLKAFALDDRNSQILNNSIDRSELLSPTILELIEIIKLARNDQ